MQASSSRPKARKASDVTNKLRSHYTSAPLDIIEIQEGWNARKNTAPSTELIQSVKQSGVLNPIHVRWKDRKKTGLYIIDGERRYNAAIAAGNVRAVPIKHHEHLNDADALVIMLSANEDQKRLTRAERADGFTRMKGEGFTLSEIAKVTGYSKDTVADTLRIEEKGDQRLRDAATKPPNKGGIPTKVAGRAAKLPAKVQKAAVPRLKGKSVKKGLEELRKIEQKSGAMKSGPEAKPGAVSKVSLKIAKNANELAREMLDIIHDKQRHNPNNKVLGGQRLVIHVLLGNLKIEDVFANKW